MDEKPKISALDSSVNEQLSHERQDFLAFHVWVTHADMIVLL